MAAVTINRYRCSVIGSKRMCTYDVSIAANGDTLAVKAVKVIDAYEVTAGSAAITNTTKSGTTLTFVTGGAVANAQVMTVGV